MLRCPDHNIELERRRSMRTGEIIFVCIKCEYTEKSKEDEDDDNRDK